MKQKLDNNSGFTLIEVLIAAAILLFGLLTMASFFGSLVTKNSSNERKTIATALAEEQIELLRNTALNTDIGPGNNGTDTVSTGAGPFTRTWTVVEDFVGVTDQITVQVDWEGTGVGNTQLTMVTLINN